MRRISTDVFNSCLECMFGMLKIDNRFATLTIVLSQATGTQVSDALKGEIRKDQARLAAKCPTENAQRAGMSEVSVFFALPELP